jgi:hypothetical protein
MRCGELRPAPETAAGFFIARGRSPNAIRNILIDKELI